MVNNAECQVDKRGVEYFWQVARLGYRARGNTQLIGGGIRMGMDKNTDE
jgi:hypothetical protein